MAEHGHGEHGGGHDAHAEHGGDHGHETKKGGFIRKLRSLITVSALLAFSLDLAMPLTMRPIQQSIETGISFVKGGGHGGGGGHGAHGGGHGGH